MKEVASFASLHQSFASMLYVLMLSNWPLFMDAAGAVEDVLMARLFFYSFKVGDIAIFPRSSFSSLFHLCNPDIVLSFFLIWAYPLRFSICQGVQSG